MDIFRAIDRKPKEVFLKFGNHSNCLTKNFFTISFFQYNVLFLFNDEWFFELISEIVGTQVKYTG